MVVMVDPMQALPQQSRRAKYAQQKERDSLGEFWAHGSSRTGFVDSPNIS